MSQLVQGSRFYRPFQESEIVIIRAGISVCIFIGWKHDHGSGYQFRCLCHSVVWIVCLRMRFAHVQPYVPNNCRPLTLAFLDKPANMVAVTSKSFQIGICSSDQCLVRANGPFGGSIECIQSLPLIYLFHKMFDQAEYLLRAKLRYGDPNIYTHSKRYKLEINIIEVTPKRIDLATRMALKDGAYYCYCAYVLRISIYSDFLPPMLTNTGIFLRGLKLSGESRSQ